VALPRSGESLWSAEDPVTDAGTQGVENSLVELGALTQPTPPPSKYYDMAWWQQAKASLTPKSGQSTVAQ
jgi:hypothetical protein